MKFWITEEGSNEEPRREGSEAGANRVTPENLDSLIKLVERERDDAYKAGLCEAVARRQTPGYSTAFAEQRRLTHREAMEFLRDHGPVKDNPRIDGSDG